ncbi:MAG: hypothetical protein WDO56_05990 [Gammaproteobacteria bacterium]
MSIHVGAWGVVVALAITLPGCALVEPRLGPDPTVEATYASAPTLPNAVAVAESLRGVYSKKVEHQIITERITGLALIGATAVAADLALRSVSKNDVLGLSLGAAALYTGTNFLVSKPQEFIYAAGANAVQCSLDAIHPLRVAHQKRNRLEALIKAMDLSVRDLDSSLTVFDTLRAEPVLRARSLSQEVKNTLPVARDALNVLDNAGGELRSSVAAIQGQVTTAIITSSPSLEGLMESLGQSLPALGSRITGVALPVPPSPPAVKTSGDDAAVKKALGKPTADLEALLVETQLIISAVEAKPSAEKLKACHVDLQEAGLTMNVVPSGDLTVQAGGSGATLSVSGGVLPYRQTTWIGPPPPADQVDLTTETGAGLITVKAKQGATAGRFTLLIRDAAQGRQTVNVILTAATAPTKGLAQNPPPGVAAATCMPDAKVKDVQQKLIDKGIKTVKIDDKDQPLTADGCHGPITDAAMRQFFKSQSADGTPVPDDAIPKTREQLFKEVSALLNP